MRSGLYRIIAFAGLLAAPLTPISAQMPIELEIGAPWEHPHSGIEVPDELGGLARERATQFGDELLNLGISFASADGSDRITLYIYRHTSGGVPVWFRQAQTAIEQRDVYAEPELALGVEPYGWPGAEAWQGLRAVYATPRSRASASTGLALFSVDGWLVKMRVSSASKGPDELAGMIDAAFGELGVPEAKVAQSALVAVEDCETKLTFRKAKDAAPDAGSAILGAILGGMVARGKQGGSESGQAVTAGPAKMWCRDGSIDPTQVAYRADGAKDAYLLALGDSGIGIAVGPDNAGQLLEPDARRSKPNYSITLITDRERINYVPQNRLPSFERVLELVNADRTVSSVSTWGDDKTINLQSDAIKD